MKITTKFSPNPTPVPSTIKPVTPPPGQPPTVSQAARIALRDALANSGQPATLIRPKSLKQQAAGLPVTPGSGKSGVSIGPAALTTNLLDRARKAGLGEFQLQALKSILEQSKDFNSDAKLVNDLLGTQNAKAGLTSLIGVNDSRQKSPERLTPDIVRALTMGVGQPLSTNPPRDGVLSPEQAVRAAEALRLTALSDYNLIQGALAKAGQAGPLWDPHGDVQMESAVILKAVAGRDRELTAPFFSLTGRRPATAAILGLADRIRGMEKEQLIQTSDALEFEFH
ncbi:MAG: hypothetical protein ACKV22_40880 [Bryobacteraceae bacterium]